MSKVSLDHRCVFTDSARIALEAPLGDELGAYAPGVGFPLVADPRRLDSALIIGMFVLRPATSAWLAPVVEGATATSMYEASDWCFNVRGVDGGWLIAGGNPLDAFRLSLQYGLADAVIVGSNTVAKEGVDHGGQPGYLWQPYGPAQWPHLQALDAHLAEKIARVRVQWQAMGLLSARRYPAQVVVSQSGEHRPPANDLFQARVFSAKHPDGSPVETLVLTSEAGAARMRARVSRYGLEKRIDSLLIVASPTGKPEELDIVAASRLLRQRHDIRIANHDGGQTVLSKFSEAGVLPQINLTLMRRRSVRDVLTASDRIDATLRQQLLDEFELKRQLFWSGDHRLPRSIHPMSVLEDSGDAAVVSFDTRALRGL